MDNRCSELAVEPGLTLYHKGPPLEYGPLPSLFYFALSGPDSLSLDPFNQPVQFLRGKMIRIFSLTLPGHENNLPAIDAMKIWADDFGKGRNSVSLFLEEARRAVQFAVDRQFALPEKLAAAGLSRGAFIAAHLSAADPRFRSILGFSPMTRLSKIKEFSHLPNHPLAEGLDLIHLAEPLSDRRIRLYIGNRDTRVGTEDCFHFAMETVKKNKSRNPQIELQIYPSIGHMGHGTPPEIFKQGADWIASHLTV